VDSSASHIQTPVQEEGKNLTFAIEDTSKYLVVEAKHGTFHNLKLKQDHCHERVQLQTYYRTKFYYLFFFTLLNEEDKLERRHNYFVVRKSLQEVEDMGYDNHQTVIQADTEITVIIPSE
jgi:hypothetical protein